MSRNNFRNKRQNNGGRKPFCNRNKGRNPKSTKETTRRKTLDDHAHYVGSAKQASDYVTITNYLINYIRRTHTKGEDIANSLENLEEISFKEDEPKMDISHATDEEEKARENEQHLNKYKIDYAAHKTRVDLYQDNKATVSALLWNQCANSMKAKIASRKDYDQIKSNPILLLAAIKQHALSYESTKYSMKTVCDALKSFINLKQRDDESALDYLKKFKAARDVFLSHVGKDFCSPS